MKADFVTWMTASYLHREKEMHAEIYIYIYKKEKKTEASIRIQTGKIVVHGYLNEEKK